jgi:hypothetical protein
MARPRRDGGPSKQPDKRKLSKTIIKGLKPSGSPYTVWDTVTRGLVIRVHSSRKTWKVVYSRHGRPRWYHIGDASAIKLPDARVWPAEFCSGSPPERTRRPREERSEALAPSMIWRSSTSATHRRGSGLPTFQSGRLPIEARTN